MDEKKLHPWEEFLKARMNAILWMKEEMGRDDKLIANQLSMDERQVYLIRLHAEKERDKETQAEAIEPSDKRKWKYECYICGARSTGQGKLVKSCDCKHGPARKLYRTI